MATFNDRYSIVVVGGMNPRLHSPFWYKHLGLISQSEFDEAINAPGTFSTPPLAQMQLAEFTVTCQLERWEIRTSMSRAADRIREITARVFDEHLPHTPVSDYEIHVSLRRNGLSSHVAKVLTRQLARIGFGIDLSDVVRSDFWFESIAPHSKRTTAISPDNEDANSVIISNRYRFNLEGRSEVGDKFNFASFLGSDLSDALTVTNDQADRVAAFLDAYLSTANG